MDSTLVTLSHTHPILGFKGLSLSNSEELMTGQPLGQEKETQPLTHRSGPVDAPLRIRNFADAPPFLPCPPPIPNSKNALPLCYAFCHVFIHHQLSVLQRLKNVIKSAIVSCSSMPTRCQLLSVRSSITILNKYYIRVAKERGDI